MVIENPPYALYGVFLNSPARPDLPVLGGGPGNDLDRRYDQAVTAHFATRAKRVIHLFMNGGPSQLDSFDPKPLLKKWAGKPIPVSFRTERKTGTAFPSPFSFKKYGKSGLSELFPHTAESADHLCVIRSMQTDIPNHEPEKEISVRFSFACLIWRPMHLLFPKASALSEIVEIDTSKLRNRRTSSDLGCLRSLLFKPDAVPCSL